MSRNQFIIFILIAILGGLSHQCAQAEERTNYVECVPDENDECVVESEVYNTKTVTQSVPVAFENSKIIRTMKDGTTQEFGEDYMIVPRKTVKREKEIVKTTIKAPKVYKKLRNNLSLLVGYGPEAHWRRGGTAAQNTVFVEDEHEFNVGIMYTRDLIELTPGVDLSGSVFIKSNKEPGAGIGLSW